MSYRFRQDQSIEQNVRRIALEQIDRAIAPQPDVSDDVWVHETRKSLKRLRSLLRLVRSADDDKAWRRRNEALRDIARALSSKRDLDVRRQTIACLGTGASKKLATALRRLSELPVSGDPATEDAGAERLSIETARQNIERLRRDYTDIDLAADFNHIADGLRAAHRAGRDALAVVGVTPTDEAFHDLRKAIQTHWRHMKLLCCAWPAMLQLRIDAAKDLSQALGNEHDLTMLVAHLDQLPRGAISQPGTAVIRREILSRQAALRSQSIAGAQRLFAQKPRQFADEISTYWQVSDRQPTNDPD